MPDLLLRVCHATSPSDFTAPTRSVGQEVGSGKFPVCASGKIGKCGRAVRPHVGVPEPKVGAVQGSIRGWPRDWRDAPACSRAVTARQKMRSCQLSRRGRLYKPGATACLRGSAPPSQIADAPLVRTRQRTRPALDASSAHRSLKTRHLDWASCLLEVCFSDQYSIRPVCTYR